MTPEELAQEATPSIIKRAIEIKINEMKLIEAVKKSKNGRLWLREHGLEDKQ